MSNSNECFLNRTYQSSGNLFVMQLQRVARIVLSMSGTTYRYKQSFSIMKFVKIATKAVSPQVTQMHS